MEQHQDEKIRFFIKINKIIINPRKSSSFISHLIIRNKNELLTYSLF
jgi:hypothetical protein